MTTAEFVTKLVQKYGKDRYDFSKVEYVTGRSKVDIICKEHGLCTVEARNALRGAICPLCRGVLTEEEFKKKAVEIHGDKYNYNYVHFTKTIDKVKIICPEHGEFYQEVRRHLAGRQCPKCLHKVPLTTQDFITRAKELHGDKYNYDKTVYKNAKTKVIVTCPTHGDFETTLAAFIHEKCGCLRCNEHFHNDFPIYLKGTSGFEGAVTGVTHEGDRRLHTICLLDGTSYSTASSYPYRIKPRDLTVRRFGNYLGYTFLGSAFIEDNEEYFICAKDGVKDILTARQIEDNFLQEHGKTREEQWAEVLQALQTNPN